jgi:O-antigen ligase
MTALPFVLLGVYYLIAMVRFNVRHTRLLVNMLAVSGVVLAGTIVVNYLVSDLSLLAMRSTAIEGSRTLTLPLLAMAGVLTVAYALTAPRGWRAWIATGAAALIFAAILMTVARAMLLAYLVGAALSAILLFSRAPRSLRRTICRRFLWSLLVFGVLALSFAQQWLNRIDPANVGDVATILGRFDEYRAFYNAFTSSPVLGQGMGYVARYPSDFDFVLRDEGITVCHSHLFFFAGTTGIVGVMLYYGLLGTALLKLWRRVPTLGESANLVAVCGMVGASIAGIIFTLTSTTFTTLSYNLFLAVLLHCAWFDWRTD